MGKIFVREMTDDDGLIARMEAFRAYLNTPEEGRRAVLAITEELRGRIAEGQKTRETLTEHLTRIREQVREQMILLKDLELEKIDRSMHYQKVANAYQNWRQQYLLHRGQGGVPVRIEHVLLEEQQFLRSNMESHVGHIIAVSNNVHRLREMKDVIERKIAHNARHMSSEVEFLKIRDKEATARPGRLQDAAGGSGALKGLREH